jgi:hypothetical protein
MTLIRHLYSIFLILTFYLVLSVNPLSGQEVPGSDENIPFLVTFGKEAMTSWGDNDFIQLVFFPYPRTIHNLILYTGV